MSSQKAPVPLDPERRKTLLLEYAKKGPVKKTESREITELVKELREVRRAATREEEIKILLGDFLIEREVSGLETAEGTIRITPSHRSFLDNAKLSKILTPAQIVSVTSTTNFVKFEDSPPALAETTNGGRR